MKILVIADEESRSLWDFWDKSKIEGIDLILSVRRSEAVLVKLLL